MYVVNFDQHLVAVHPKRRLKKLFSAFFFAKKLKNAKKVTNLVQNLAKKLNFKFAPKCWSTVLFQR